MSRLLFDTDDLRSIARSFSAGGSAVDDISRSTRSGLAGVALNLDDPQIRAANVPERQAHVSRALDSVALELVDDADAFVGLAARLEGDQADSGGWLFDMPVWGALGVGSLGVSLASDAVLTVTGLAVVEGVADGIRTLLGRFERAARVGRSRLDTALGLAGEAAGWFGQHAERFKDRLVQLASALWNAIWNEVTERFNRFVAGIAQVVSTVARLAELTVDAVRQVGRWIVDTVGGLVALNWEAVFDVLLATLAKRLVSDPRVIFLIAAILAVAVSGTTDLGTGFESWAYLADPRNQAALLLILSSPEGITGAKEWGNPTVKDVPGLQNEIPFGVMPPFIDVKSPAARLAYANARRSEPLSTFLRREEVYQYVQDGGFDGCSKVEDVGVGFDFRAACLRHDIMYAQFKELGAFDDEMKERIDRQFLADMQGLCRLQPAPMQGQCLTRAELYYRGVRYLANLVQR
jgi:hypothetical protein